MTRQVMYTIIAILLMLSVPVHAAGDLKKLPGYFNIEKLEPPKNAEEITEVDLGPEVLKGALGVDALEDPELVKMLEGIESVRVRTYTCVSEDDVGNARTAVERMEDDLAKSGWSRIVRSRSDSELTNISLRFENGLMVGIVVLSVDDTDVSLINVAGKLDLGSILSGLSGGDIDLSALDSLRLAVEEAEEE